LAGLLWALALADIWNLEQMLSCFLLDGKHFFA
jgi:hypothetical protein